ncbi:MAG: hypothetical protein ACRD1Z_06620 [Vicinamibacteria bacterium]
MTTLSKRIEETERRSQALLADLIPLVSNREVAEDPEFIAALEKALDQAERSASRAKTELRMKEVQEPRPRETTHP